MTQSILDKLQMEVMNMPCKIRDEDWTPAEQFIYKLGHRDARHEAIEILLTYAKQLES